MNAQTKADRVPAAARCGFVAVALLALCSAGVATAAPPLKVIAVQVKVLSLNGTTSGTFALGDALPVKVGEQVRMDLVGTGIVDGAGIETPLNARFNVAAGSGNISIDRSGPNWVIVNVNAAGGNGLAQLGYTVNGNYELRASDRSGRITFKIGDSASNPPPATAAPYDRAAHARHLASTLYLAILGQQPSGPQAQADYDRTFRYGRAGVLDVATELAQRAEQLGRGRSLAERGYEEQDIQRVGVLYRELLKRQQSNAELWQQDGGFRDNVRALHRKGLAVVVQGLVNSEEFIAAHKLRDF